MIVEINLKKKGNTNEKKIQKEKGKEKMYRRTCHSLGFLLGKKQQQPREMCFSSSMDSHEHTVWVHPSLNRKPQF
ncbi:Uncharacterized protein APZ42_021990 [Daphnia magna]|uniref:Uncharacterized protein n=1 Tax=Daphnia magna TaxID=35525 RepID=A0A164W6D6_9CRUS|nr:Uncharacterized protein APZ42_021990 [Daphnia magna]